MKFKVGIFLLVLTATACSLKGGSNTCKVEEDCREGQSCDVEYGQCYKKQVVVCDKDCGDGFFCQTIDAADVCRVKEGREGTAAIRSPESGVVSGAARIQVTCEAQAPQFRDLLLTVKQPSGEVVALTGATRRTDTDLFDATFDAEPETVVDGDYEFGCKLSYGPDEAIVETLATPVTVLVDRVSPTITIEPLSAWQRREGTTIVTASMVDYGGTDTKHAGIDATKVKLVADGKSFPGMPSTGDKWTFSVALGEVTPATIEGALAFEVHASDLAENRATATGSMNVDALPPTVSLVADGAWLSRDSVPFSVTATALSTGAPVSSVKLTGADGTPSVAGVLNAGKYEFEIDPRSWQKENEEAPVAWTVTATDEAGNTATASGQFKIDGKGPGIVVTAPDWVGGVATSHSLQVSVSDAGVGLDSTQVAWSAGGQTGACAPGAGSTFACPVALTTPTGGVDENYAVTVSAEDTFGNATTKPVKLKVDRKGPQLVFASDGSWHARSATVVVKAQATDSGAGLGATPVLKTTSPIAATVNGRVDATTGEVTFDVVAKGVTNAGTTADVKGTIRVFDALGNFTDSPSATLLKVDDQPPVVTLGSKAVGYPAGRTNVLRREVVSGQARSKATITATVVEPGAGSGISTVKLSFVGADGKAKEVSTGNVGVDGVYVFDFDAALARFNQGEGQIAVDVVAVDGVGNRATSPVEVGTTRELWTFTTDRSSAVNAGISLFDSRVLFTVKGVDGDKPNVFSVNSQTGTAAWSAKIDGTPTTPVTVGTNALYFAYTATGNKTWMAKYPLNPVGTPAQSWTCNTAGSGLGSITGGLALAEWAVVDGGAKQEFVFAVNSTGRIYALHGDCQSGNRLVSSLASPSGGTIVVDGEQLWAVGSNGAVGRLKYEAVGFGEPTFTNIGNGAAPGLALFAMGNALALSYDGAFELNALPSSITHTTFEKLKSLVTAPPVVASSGNAYFGSDDGYLFKMQQGALTGTSVLMPGIPAEKVKGAPVVDAAERVYLVTEDGVLRAYDSELNPLWNYNTEASGVTHSSPALSCDGVVYVGTSDGRVVALVADEGGLDPTAPWPKYQHDNRNTGNAGTSLCP